MSTDSVKVLPDKLLSLRDRLSRLTFTNACKLLGPQGRLLISSNANKWQISIPDDVQFDGDTLRVKFPLMLDEPPVTVIIERNPEALQSLRFYCDVCKNACDHVGAVFSLVLEEKTALGLAVPPPERLPVESLGENDLVKQALADREKRAREEKMTVIGVNLKQPWTDYAVTNRLSGKSYLVKLRGF